MTNLEITLLTFLLIIVALFLANLYVKLVDKPKKVDKIEVHHLKNGNTIIVCYVERRNHNAED